MSLALVARADTVFLSVQPNPAKTDNLVIATASTTAAFFTNFTWVVNGLIRTDLSGLGKTTAAFPAPSDPGTLRIGVLAKNGTNATSSAEVLVPLALSEETKAVRKLTGQADELLNQEAEAASQLQVSLSQTPENPAPGERVSFRVESFQSDLAGADIAWYQNGKRILAGTGAAFASIQLGSAGSATDIQVSIRTPDGKSAEILKTITPAAVDFYWWADSYTPVWYQGKALPSPGSTIFIRARPSFPPAMSKTLVYTWILDDDIVASASGAGRALFAYTIPQNANSLDPIRVRITNAAGTIRQEAAFQTPLVSPEILVYEAAPLVGVNPAEAISAIARPAGKTVDVVAEPFFAPRASLASFQYRWSVNGRNIPETSPKRSRILTLTSDRNAKGAQDITITIGDLKNRLVELNQSIRLTLE